MSFTDARVTGAVRVAYAAVAKAMRIKDEALDNIAVSKTKSNS